MTDEPTPAVAPAEPSAPADPATGGAESATAPAVEDDLLVEDVSIDGMCGVY